MYKPLQTYPRRPDNINADYSGRQTHLISILIVGGNLNINSL